MKKRQYNALLYFLFIGLMLFVILDVTKGFIIPSINYCNTNIATQPISAVDVYCVVKDEVFTPFIWLFAFSFFYVLFGRKYILDKEFHKEEKEKPKKQPFERSL